MKLSEGKAILLFRFHDNPEVAKERLNIIRHFNPELDFYVLYGGDQLDAITIKNELGGLVKGFWIYPEEKEKKWKWRHSDLILKDWYRAVGKQLDFDFLYSYEYDLLTLKSLWDIYPDVDDNTLALAACEPFTEKIERSWTWTNKEPYRSHFLEFQKYIKDMYGIERQQKVCLGPGPLFPRKFLEAWSQTEDIDLVQDEISYPAYAEALGFRTVDHGMHKGFSKTDEETKLFNCNSNRPVTIDMILSEISKPDGCRAFHPVKYLVTLSELTDTINLR